MLIKVLTWRQRALHVWWIAWKCLRDRKLLWILIDEARPPEHKNTFCISHVMKLNWHCRMSGWGGRKCNKFIARLWWQRELFVQHKTLCIFMYINMKSSFLIIKKSVNFSRAERKLYFVNFKNTFWNVWKLRWMGCNVCT